MRETTLIHTVHNVFNSTQDGDTKVYLMDGVKLAAVDTGADYIFEVEL